MDPEQNIQTESVQATEPAASSTYSKEQVDALIAEAAQRARDSAFAEARRVMEGKQPKAQSTAKSAPQIDQADVTAKAIAYGAAMSGINLTPAARSRLTSDMLTAQVAPESASGFVTEWMTAQGYSVASAPAAATNDQQPKAQAKAASEPPASDRGVPAANTQGESPSDVMRWTTEDVQAYIRQNGKVPGNMYDVRNRPVISELRRRAEAQLAQMQIYIGPPKR